MSDDPKITRFETAKNRGPKGRFAKGGPGGPGRPRGHSGAAVREAILLLTIM